MASLSTPQSIRPIVAKQTLARRSPQAVPLAVHSVALRVSPDELKAAIVLFYGLLDEQQRRLFAGLESIRVGHGGDTLLGDFLGLDAHTVARGRQQLLDQAMAKARTEDIFTDEINPTSTQSIGVHADDGQLTSLEAQISPGLAFSK